MLLMMDGVGVVGLLRRCTDTHAMTGDGEGCSDGVGEITKLDRGCAMCVFGTVTTVVTSEHLTSR